MRSHRRCSSDYAVSCRAPRPNDRDAVLRASDVAEGQARSSVPPGIRVTAASDHHRPPEDGRRLVDRNRAGTVAPRGEAADHREQDATGLESVRRPGYPVRVAARTRET